MPKNPQAAAQCYKETPLLCPFLKEATLTAIHTHDMILNMIENNASGEFKGVGN